MEKLTDIPILTLRFDNAIEEREIPLFRGVVIKTTEGQNLLFHNHDGEKLRYRYPLIQYKRIEGKAAIVCIGNGTQAIENFFQHYTHPLRLGRRSFTPVIASATMDKVHLTLKETLTTYHIQRYVALNEHNYERYQELERLADKYALLEQCLIGNILSFAKSMNVHFENKVRVNIVSSNDCQPAKYKNIILTAFDLTFKTNVILPNYIGLGGKVSVGFGIIKVINQQS